MVEQEIPTTISQRPLERLTRNRSASDEPAFQFDFLTPIERSCWFVCPTLTPLYYAPVYHDLDVRHQLRYNQLTALSFSELISFFETSFASSVLVALARCDGNRDDSDLARCLESFVEEERRHTEWWQNLNRLSEPEIYRKSDRVIIRISPAIESMLRQLTNRPVLFPLVFWVMLALEERSLEISRRCLRMSADQIEPRYQAIYRAHLAHESRHVQIDWHLIDRYFAASSAAVRRLNATLFRLAIQRYFLPPTRTAMRVLDRLMVEFKELQSVRSEMRRQLVRVGDDPAYHEMMYSRKSTPVTFSLFDRFSEFHAMRHVLHSYVPPRSR
jgi:hypothetical protein